VSDTERVDEATPIPGIEFGERIENHLSEFDE
jgi:hypothetical protein